MKNVEVCRVVAVLLLAVLVPACDGSASSAGNSFKPVPPPQDFALALPEDGATEVPLRPTLYWLEAQTAHTYTVQVSTTSDFSGIVVVAPEVLGLAYTLNSDLAHSTTYWWRVYGVNGSSTRLALGSPRSFTTLAPPPPPPPPPPSPPPAVPLRRVAFQSEATNLVPDDTNERTDMFVRDIVSGTTTRASVSPTGAQLLYGEAAQGSMTPDGRYLAIQNAGNDFSTGTNYSPLCVKDLDTGAIQICPAIPDRSIGGSPSLSANGRLVAFTVFQVGGPSDIYVWDRQTGTVTDISLTPSGSTTTTGYCYNPAFSGDGRFVAWESFKTDLIPGGTNGFRHIFVRDLVAGVTERVSVSSSGVQGNQPSLVPSISADGRFVAFTSAANNLAGADTNFSLDVFVRDRLTGTTEVVSLTNAGAVAIPLAGGEPQPPSISADGRYVAFEHGGRLVGQDLNSAMDIYVRDRQGGTTQLLSVSMTGTAGNGDSRWPSFYPGGGYVAFASDASDLVAGDNNGFKDIFLYNLTTSTLTRISVATGGIEANGLSNVPVASGP